MRLELREVDPTVWRRLLVPDGITMADLAEILLLAMGWGDVHLHFFEVGDVSYGAADEDADDDEIDERSVIVSDALGSHDEFDFEYDLGDGWEHHVVIEERSASVSRSHTASAGRTPALPKTLAAPEDMRTSWKRSPIPPMKITPKTSNGSEDRSIQPGSTSTPSMRSCDSWRSGGSSLDGVTAD